jgi:hypothetical protein
VERFSLSGIDCRVKLDVGRFRFAQFGQDDNLFVNGGCERNARGQFETGAPDRYLDAGERLVLAYGFTVNEGEALADAEVRLRCVVPDGDSPESCAPDSDDCADPTRSNNADCPQMTIGNSPIVLGTIPPDTGLSANFNVVMAEAIAGTPEVELVLEISAAVSGKTARGVSVRRITLNVDESSVFYSTDYPQGGTELQDRNNNERIDDPLTLIAEPTLRSDLRFETVVYSDLTAGGTKNLGLQSPWSFDLDDGGFTSGLNAATDFGQITDTITNWGEDLNFNDQLDYYCSGDESLVLPGGRPGCDPDNDQCGLSGAGVCLSLEDRDVSGTPGVLDQNWSTRGGCGWQTRAPGNCSTTTTLACYVDADCPASESCDTAVPQATGGAWHTGTIGDTTGECIIAGGSPGQCQLFETVGGATRQREWVELLVTPEIQRVGGDDAQVEITNWAWNMAIDLPDDNTGYTWQLDTDSRQIEPVDLFGDLSGAFQGTGSFGAVSGGGSPQLTRGWNLFAPMSPDGSVSENGTVGNNRVGKNACFFEDNLTEDARRHSTRCSQDAGRGCLSDTQARGVDGLSDPRDDDLKNGVCTHDQSACRMACSGDPLQPCNDDSECTSLNATCTAPLTPRPCCTGAGTGDCGQCVATTADCVVRTEPCTSHLDCTTATGGRCIPYQGTCTILDVDGNPIPCLFFLDCGGFAFCRNREQVCAYGCEVGSSAIDEYVTPAGPIRNYDLQAWNGPDLRFSTLEDEYGPTGEYFRAAIGLRTREPAPSSPAAEPGYGLGVDDMVVEWREFTLVEDAADCAPGGLPGEGGSCASLDAEASSYFEGSALLTATVVETSPSPNDCDGDGSVDVPDDFDCDDDGTPDVVVLATSLSEVAGERIVANLTSDPCLCEYVGVLPISAAYDAAGVLFVRTLGPEGPVVELAYEDRDDGTGQICRNSVFEEQQGRVRITLPVQALTGNLVVTGQLLFDGQTAETHGDEDGFADTNETVGLQIEVTNRTGRSLQGVTARLSTNDPKIDCILRTEVTIGDLPGRAAGSEPKATSQQPFLFRIADVQRDGFCIDRRGEGSMTACTGDGDCPITDEFCSAPFEPFSVELTITLSSAGKNRIESSAMPQAITLDLDLDVSGGSGPGSFHEDFETATNFGSFVTANLDQSLGSTIAADGYRCQYSDPDWPASNVYGSAEAAECFPGVSGSIGGMVRQSFNWLNNSADPNDPSPDGGRAFNGVRSLYFGRYGPTPDENTTPMGTLEVVRSLSPINLAWSRVCEVTVTQPCAGNSDCTASALGQSCTAGTCSVSGLACSVDADCDEACVPVSPELSFMQQVSLMDNPPHGCIGPVQGPGRTADRAILQLQLAGEDHIVPALAPGIGPWIKLDPFMNGYDIQPADNFISCSFDPIDDGTIEDDYFDPTDPNRRLGPSSTCFPEFVWAAVGATDGAFSPSKVWRGDGPGLEGSVGGGTWVETKVDLSRFRGKRVRLRFLASTLHDPTAATWEELFAPLNPNPCDDGWWIDAITVTNTLSAPATVTADLKPNDSAIDFPACGPTCNTITAQLDADPVATTGEPLPAPGQAVELDAGASSADRCLDGVLQYRFWLDGNGDGQGGDPADTLLRDWTDDRFLLRAPAATRTYVVDARCSSAPGCVGSTSRLVVVDCPASGNLGGGVFQTITAPDKVQFVWSLPEDVTFAEGNLATLPTYTTSNSGTLPAAASLPMSTAQWYLLKGSAGGAFCNQAAAWTSGGPGELPGRDLPGNLP